MRLRYILGGDRPSQTTRLALSIARIHGAMLEIQYTKGGHSSLAPPRPQPELQSLPPILSEVHRIQIPNEVKVHGVFRLAAGTGIFTETAISPSPSLRQR